ncbi:FG-GAP repeat domain-containing protein [Streptomyces sp. NPDC001530]|uniref:FG-GAP repeat domain-containing protein n=1 Tax=Streptomyces sp. NPDC001530 TaxID=3364582 RepID=UPI0036C35168
MGGRKFVRRRVLGRGGTALAAVLAVAAGSLGLLPSGTAVAATGADEIVLPAAVRTSPRNPVFSGYGDTGLLSQPEGSAHLRWTDYATGESRDLPQYDGAPGPVRLAQSDTVYEMTTTKPYVVRFTDLPSGADRGQVTVPQELNWGGTAGGTVVAYLGSVAAVREVHLLKPAADGAVTDMTVTGWPEGAQLLAVDARDARSLLMRYRMSTDDPKVFLDQLVLVDVRDGSVAKVFAPYKAGSGRSPFLSHDYVGWWYPGAGARLVRRDDLDGPVTEVPAQGTEGKIEFTVVGDQVVVADADTRAVLTRPLGGGTWRELFPTMGGWIDPAPDGSAVVPAGSGPQDWGVQRLTESADGQLVAREIIDLPPVPAPIDGLSLANGTLNWTDQTAPPSSDVMFNSRTVPAGSNPQVGPVRQGGAWVKPCGVWYGCMRLFGAGDGSTVYSDPWSYVYRRTPAGEVQSVLVPDSSGDVVAAYGRYAVLSGGTNHKQHIVDWTQSKVVSTRTATAATVWDGQLWTTTSTAGHVSMSRLGSDVPAVDVNVGSACVPSELQVDGRWVYWACAAQGTAGVFDRSRGRSVSVPAGDALLADGFLVRHDAGRGKLVRTDFASGKAVTNDVADLPRTKNLAELSGGSDRRIRWTVDPYGSRVAFVDPGERIHLLTAGSPAAPAFRDHAGRDGLSDLLTLNSSGALTFQQGTGKGGFAGKVSGSGWSTTVVAVPFGDLNNDRCNDVLVRMSDGSLRGYTPACGQALVPSTSYKALGTGWNAYNVLTSPGDLTGDKRPDLLARKASTGDVYLFAAKSDGTLAAAKKIRTAWTGYTKIVGAGDLNGDGFGDVLARDRAGTLYRYNGTGTGLLKDRVKVFSGWGASYNAIVGVGDITGDGKNDLVERDSSGNLYRNDGKGNGSFGSRVKIASGWQGYKGLF